LEGAIIQAKNGENIAVLCRKAGDMQINTHYDKMLIEIWLTNDEKMSADVRRTVSEICAKRKPSKFKVAVFESGGRDLARATAELLTYNRNLAGY
jgi:hypothetical protein